MTLFRRMTLGPKPPEPEPDTRDFEANVAAHWRD